MFYSSSQCWQNYKIYCVLLNIIPPKYDFLKHKCCLRRGKILPWQQRPVIKRRWIVSRYFVLLLFIQLVFGDEYFYKYYLIAIKWSSKWISYIHGIISDPKEKIVYSLASSSECISSCPTILDLSGLTSRYLGRDVWICIHPASNAVIKSERSERIFRFSVDVSQLRICRPPPSPSEVAIF